ncbi:hypothetical protein RKD26_003959 [Streptomyces calvus]
MLGEDLSLVVLRNTLRRPVIPLAVGTEPRPTRYPSATTGNRRGAAQSRGKPV